MVCICEDDGIDADCEVHGTMSDDQEQAPFDLAVGERLLAASQDMLLPWDWRRERWELFVEWLRNNGEALVAALKARDEQNKELSHTLELIRTRELEFIHRWRGHEPIERYLRQPDYGELLDFLQADLARVEAERDQYRHAIDVMFPDHALQARIAELEGSLRALYGTHSIPFGSSERDGPCWCGDCERARANLAEPQTPTAS